MGGGRRERKSHSTECQWKVGGRGGRKDSQHHKQGKDGRSNTTTNKEKENEQDGSPYKEREDAVEPPTKKMINDLHEMIAANLHQTFSPACCGL